MRSFHIVPCQAEWDTAFWEKFQDPLYQGKGTVTDLAKTAPHQLDIALGKWLVCLCRSRLLKGANDTQQS